MAETLVDVWTAHPLKDDADALVWRHGGPVRTGWLTRIGDVSGVSGVGRVAQAVECRDGAVVLAWRPACEGCGSGVSLFGSEAEALVVHGHGGLTEIVWKPIARVHRFR